MVVRDSTAEPLRDLFENAGFKAERVFFDFASSRIVSTGQKLSYAFAFLTPVEPWASRGGVALEKKQQICAFRQRF